MPLHHVGRQGPKASSCLSGFQGLGLVHFREFRDLRTWKIGCRHGVRLWQTPCDTGAYLDLQSLTPRPCTRILTKLCSTFVRKTVLQGRGPLPPRPLLTTASRGSPGVGCKALSYDWYRRYVGKPYTLNASPKDWFSIAQRLPVVESSGSLHALKHQLKTGGRSQLPKQ